MESKKIKALRFRGVLKVAVIGLIIAGSIIFSFACNKSSGKELTIYSGRKEKYIKPIVQEFEKKTGITVKLLAGDASQLANQLIEEKKNPRADVFISNDAGTLGFLSNEEMLVKYESEATKRVRDDLKDRDGMWVGASARARVIMYNTDLVKEDEAPTTLMGLTDPKWNGKVGSANSTNESMTGHVSALRIAKGDAFAEDWLKKLKANDPVLNKSHDPIRDAIADGELYLGLVNHYYYAKKKAEGKPVGAVYPDQDDFGTMVNVSGMAVVKGAKKADLAHKFIDFVLSDEIQKKFAGVNKEMPVVESVKPDGEVKSFDEFKRADVKLDELGDKLDSTLEMMERLGL